MPQKMSERGVTANDILVQPPEYKDAMRFHTLGMINENSELPPSGRASWNLFWTYNSYGSDGDIFRSEPSEASPEENALVGHMFSDARNYAASALITASKKLPPLIKDLKIHPTDQAIPIIDTDGGNSITLDILENRTDKVKVYMAVDGPPVPWLAEAQTAGIPVAGCENGKEFSGLASGNRQTYNFA